ncbi:unnamed protein product [Parascedosporium putredinis]|uniref:Rhodopsin domain-containing protein n=1 Tax=Parascedosporium putredinis TaxID=1442378 RepID=A0A9P1H5Y7_9PEZI|nr:unnamed protein product [Parascedosporium putredinis]CAI7996881.1 unnamed protein product [Parascedosporium putredinis]
MASETDNRGPELLAVNITFFSAALVSIFLRCYVRTFMVRAFGIDDWLMVAGTVGLFTLYAAFSSTGVKYGTGQHHANLEDENIKKAMMCWWFCYLWYSLAMVSSKLSIGWFLLRVTTTKLYRWIIFIAMGSTAFSGLVFFFVTLFQCNPIPYFWNKDLEGKCVNIEVVIALAILYSVTAVISDFIFAILPAVIVWQLQLHKRTKLMLIPLLAMGCVASSAVVVRFPFLPKFREPDFLWNTLDIAIWSTIEQGLAITAGSLATLRPLIKLLAFRLGLTTKPKSMRPSDYATNSRPLGVRKAVAIYPAAKRIASPQPTGTASEPTCL